jgi:hypothetical protein
LTRRTTSLALAAAHLHGALAGRGPVLAQQPLGGDPAGAADLLWAADSDEQPVALENRGAGHPGAKQREQVRGAQRAAAAPIASGAAAVAAAARSNGAQGDVVVVGGAADEDAGAGLVSGRDLDPIVVAGIQLTWLDRAGDRAPGVGSGQRRRADRRRPRAARADVAELHRVVGFVARDREQLVDAGAPVHAQGDRGRRPAASARVDERGALPDAGRSARDRVDTDHSGEVSRYVTVAVGPAGRDEGIGDRRAEDRRDARAVECARAGPVAGARREVPRRGIRRIFAGLIGPRRRREGHAETERAGCERSQHTREREPGHGNRSFGRTRPPRWRAINPIPRLYRKLCSTGRKVQICEPAAEALPRLPAGSPPSYDPPLPGA